MFIVRTRTVFTWNNMILTCFHDLSQERCNTREGLAGQYLFFSHLGAVGKTGSEELHCLREGQRREGQLTSGNGVHLT